MAWCLDSVACTRVPNPHTRTRARRYGLFQHCVVAVEMVMASGEVVVATADNEHKELFHSVPWSHGSLGFLMSATLRIVPCKPWVRLTYQVRDSRLRRMGIQVGVTEGTKGLGAAV